MFGAEVADSTHRACPISGCGDFPVEVATWPFAFDQDIDPAKHWRLRTGPGDKATAVRVDFAAARPTEVSAASD